MNPVSHRGGEPFSTTFPNHDHSLHAISVVKNLLIDKLFGKKTIIDIWEFCVILQQNTTVKYSFGKLKRDQVGKRIKSSYNLQ